MKRATRAQEILTHLIRGKAYRLEKLAKFSNSVGRDTKRLEQEGFLRKLSPGLFYYPKFYPLGEVPPDQDQLISEFLKTKDYLVLSPNTFNKLGLGLTQLRNEVWVYNKKRSGVFKFGNREFQFRRPLNGYPKKITKEYLLLELMNNMSHLGEEKPTVLSKITQKLNKFDLDLLKKLSSKYGKVGTKKFFRSI